ncbi:isatin hydrolase-like [Styela clava]
MGMRSTPYFLLVVMICSAHAAPSQKERGCRRARSNLSIRIRKDNIIDLTHVTDERSAYWPNNPSGFEMVEIFKGFVETTTRFFYSTYMFSQPEHLGTHMDAPNHFFKGGLGADEVSLYKLIGPGVLINPKKNGTLFGKDSFITVDHFLEWERVHDKRIHSGSIVLLYTGYSDVYYDRSQYYGTNATGDEAVPLLHFPGLDPKAAEWLVTNRCIGAIGIDTASIDQARSKDFLVHQFLAKHEIPALENVGNLGKLAAANKGFKVIALPSKNGGGTGAPARIIAVLN